MPAAPGLLSTATLWPNCSVKYFAIILADASVPPPGAAGTTIAIGLSGYFSLALANMDREGMNTMANAKANRRLTHFKFMINTSKLIIPNGSQLLDQLRR
jgi:hypothetical protein